MNEDVRMTDGRWFAAWIVVGCALALGLISFGAGLLVLIPAVVVAALLGRSARARRGADGGLVGIGVLLLFVAYLMVLFQIISDLFRDKDTSGWVKAIWIIALIFFPLITALVYLIARGRGMAERQAATVGRMQEAQDAYIKSVAGSKSAAEEIAQAKSLLDSGTISQAEYDTLKAKALA